jgi:hypothetical protein
MQIANAWERHWLRRRALLRRFRLETLGEHSFPARCIPSRRAL